MNTQKKQQIRIILGSSSPRRKEILTEMGYQFEVLKPAYQEKYDPKFTAEEYVLHNAIEKGHWIVNSLGNELNKPTLVLSADTIVVYKEQILEKPKDQEHSLQMLETLSGQTHCVMTAYSINFYQTNTKKWHQIESKVIKTLVTFNHISKEKIIDYIKTGEPADKAGSYGIQGMGSFLVKNINGSLSNVIGLPKDEVKQAIQSIINI
ncbi:MAG: Maf family protein [Bdellovibrionota bacterium]